MKSLLGIVLMLLIAFDPGKIGKINTMKSEARAAFQNGDFKTAISKYKYLVDSLDVHEDEVAMNLANAYFQAKDTLNAFNTYLPLTQSNTKRIRSIANQQLGVLANRQSKFDDALNYFKQSMIAAPENEEARFNYEMVKKKLEEKKKQDQQNKDKEKNKDNKDKKDDKKKDQKDQKKDEQNKDKKEDQKKGTGQERQTGSEGQTGSKRQERSNQRPAAEKQGRQG